MSQEESIDLVQQTEEIINEAVEEAQQDAAQQEAPVEVSKEAKPDKQAYNWAESRRRMAALERENEELRRKSQPVAPKDDYSDVDRLQDDEIMTVAQARKMAAREAQRAAEEAVRRHSASTVDERVRAKYPDVDSVVNAEAIEQLRQNDPEVAFVLSQVKDPYAQAVAAYKVLKGLTPQVVSNHSSNSDKKRATENSVKPRSVQTVTNNSAIGNAHLFENGLTPELKQQLWKEMQQSMKG